MAINAPIAVDTALYSRLSGDATLVALLPGGIHNLEAPHDANQVLADFPLLVFQMLPTTDEYVLGQDAVAVENMPYIFRAGSRGNDESVVHTILDRVHTLLQGYALSVTGYGLITLHRTGRGNIIPVSEYGITYLQGTTRYAIEVQPT